MKKTMTRNMILMAVATAAMACALTFYVRTAANLPSGGAVAYADGTYTAEAEGFSSTYPVVVTVTVSGGTVTAVEVDASNETPEVGGAAAEQLAAAIQAAGTTAGVDGISGATWTSNGVLSAAADCLTQAKG